MVAGYGRVSLVRADDGVLLPATARSRKVLPLCGDRVLLASQGTAECVIEAIAPRTSIFERANGYRRKPIAANATQLVVLAACEPSFSDELICRMLVAAEGAGLAALIVLNKVDLTALRGAAMEQLDPFRRSGYRIVELSGKADAGPLRPYLQGHRSLFAGQSGMGKSTLLKTLVPDAEVRIREISHYLNAGRQSTTAARLHTLDESSELIDSPGLSEFGLGGAGAREIAAGFREFAPHSANCRFQDCRHLDEPDCGIREATARGEIHPRRLALYQRIVRLEQAAKTAP